MCAKIFQMSDKIKEAHLYSVYVLGGGGGGPHGLGQGSLQGP